MPGKRPVSTIQAMPDDIALSLLRTDTRRGSTTLPWPRPIRLLVVNHTTLYSGSEKILTDLVSRFPSGEVQVLAIVAPGRGPARAVWEGIGVRCIDLPVPHFRRVPAPLLGGMQMSVEIPLEFPRWIYFLRKFSDLLRQEAPDLVYAISTHAAIAVAPVLSRAHVPWLWQIPDIVKERRLNRLALRSAVRNANAIMALSRATENSIIRLGADPSKVHQVYAGVDIKEFDLPACAAEQFRAGEGIDAKAPLVGMFGQVTRWKGWHIFVEAIPQVAKHFPTARFVCVGRPMTGPDHRYQSALQARQDRLGVDRLVRWTGFRPDVPRIMTACDVIVHASVEPEPLGLVIIEGMAARKPVICTSGGGTEEVVTQNETGLVVPPADPAALADAINKLLGDPTLRVQMGKKGRQVVELNFTHEHRVRAFLKVFGQLVGKHAGKIAQIS